MVLFISITDLVIFVSRYCKYVCTMLHFMCIYRY